MRKTSTLTAIFATLALSGCASIVEGTDQNIAVQASAPGAQCRAQRQGEPLFALTAPASVTVSKSRHGFALECETGDQVGAVFVDSHVTAMGAAGVALDFGLTDYATGALNAYPASVIVLLHPKGAK